jgi:hypothetical protein
VFVHPYSVGQSVVSRAVSVSVSETVSVSVSVSETVSVSGGEVMLGEEVEIRG